MQDQGNEIADALDRLHARGWSIGDTAFHDIEHSRVVWVISGTNGENLIRAEGGTCSEAWRRALDQAAAVGMLRGGRGRRGSRVSATRRGRYAMIQRIGYPRLVATSVQPQL